VSDASPARPPRPSDLEPSPPAARRDRWRLGHLAGPTLASHAPWVGDEAGPRAAGAPALLALTAAWGLALATSLARTRGGLARGECAVAAAVAAALALLLAADHPWLRAAARRSSWIPIFAPLALLGLLDLATRRGSPAGEAPGREITAIRGASALLAAAALVVALEPLPAATAAFLGATPFLVHFAASARGARRALEGASLAAALVLLAAPSLETAARPPSFAAVAPTLWPYVFRVLALALAGVAAVGLLSPEDRALVPLPAAPRRP
jgi:hypothetical protein